MKKHYTDNDIENLLTAVSGDVFSVREDHFKKILQSIDIDSSLEKKAVQQTHINFSPYMFIQSNIYRFAGAAAVFIVALFGAVSYTNTGAPNLTNVPLAQNNTDVSLYDGSMAANTVNTETQTYTVPPSADTNNVAMARIMTSKAASSPESHAISTSVQALQTAEESAADDLLALNEF